MGGGRANKSKLRGQQGAVPLNPPTCTSVPDLGPWGYNTVHTQTEGTERSRAVQGGPVRRSWGQAVGSRLPRGPGCPCYDHRPPWEGSAAGSSAHPGRRRQRSPAPQAPATRGRPGGGGAGINHRRAGRGRQARGSPGQRGPRRPASCAEQPAPVAAPELCPGASARGLPAGANRGVALGFSPGPRKCGGAGHSEPGWGITALQARNPTVQTYTPGTPHNQGSN